MTKELRAKIRRRVKAHTKISLDGRYPDFDGVDSSEARLIQFIEELCEDAESAGRIHGWSIRDRQSSN